MSTPVLIALVIGVVLPALTAVITRDAASPKLKALLTGGLAVLTGAITTAVTSPPKGTSGWEELVATVLVAWVASAAAYFFGWKPTGAAHAIAQSTERFGFSDAGSDQTP